MVTNAEQLDRCVRQLRENQQIMRENRWFLKWFGWFPLASMVRDAHADLVIQDRKLTDATIRLWKVDHEKS